MVEVGEEGRVEEGRGEGGGGGRRGRGSRVEEDEGALLRDQEGGGGFFCQVYKAELRKDCESASFRFSPLV